jgi:hypothetical protein
MRLAPILFCAWLLLSVPVAAQNAATEESTYFTIQLDDKADIIALTDQLRSVRVRQVEGLTGATSDAHVMLHSLLDALYSEVCDILDIHMPAFTINLEVVTDRAGVANGVEACSMARKEAPSFYCRDSNTIYIANKDVSVGVLGHEIAHAVINQYFMIPPPEKMQEVMAGYVEYSLMKSLTQ